jgi:glycosyltransferase involved in cell wall biosynthesis
MGDPVVSIVTPTYKQSSFLRETIDSVLKQDYPSIEYQVINDGSPDDTEHILQSYTDRIQWETQKNSGQTPTINKGWRRATGQILAYLNSDDTYLHATVVSDAVRYLHSHPDVGVIYGRSVYTDATGKVLGEYNAQPFDYLDAVRYCRNPIPQPSAFIRREVLDDVGFLDDQLYYSMDWDFWLRAGHKHRIEFVPELWSTYRLHENSKSVAGLAKAGADVLRIYEKLFVVAEVPPELQRERNVILTRARLKAAELYFAGGDTAQARRCFWYALKENAIELTSKHYVKFALSIVPGGYAAWNLARS